MTNKNTPGNVAVALIITVIFVCYGYLTWRFVWQQGWHWQAALLWVLLGLAYVKCVHYFWEDDE